MKRILFPLAALLLPAAAQAQGYASYCSINPRFAERTGFSEGGAEIIKAILPKPFENDASSVRPDGSMQVLSIIW